MEYSVLINTCELDTMSPVQRDRAENLAGYRKNPKHCLNIPGTFRKDPGGCMPNDPHGRTAPLRYDNRHLKYCDRCREKMGLSAEARDAESDAKGRVVSQRHREALREGQRKSAERRGFVKCPGLFAIKEKAGKSYSEIVAACGDGYTYHGVRGWALEETRAPLSKLHRLAEVLGCTVEDITGRGYDRVYR